MEVMSCRSCRGAACPDEGTATSRPPSSNSDPSLMQVLSRRGAARVLIFCNKIETCRVVENHLARSDRLGSKYKVRLGGAR